MEMRKAKKESNISTIAIKDERHYDKDASIKEWLENWEFKKSEPKTYTHRIHNYPAIFIPQLVRKIIEQYSDESDVVLDIFNGSGTTSVECTITNRTSIGIELNPLANLLAEVKTTLVNPHYLIEGLEKVKYQYLSEKHKYTITRFRNIDYWYSNEAIENISKLLSCIKSLENTGVRNFMLVAISKILREVSVCKHSGFKMHKAPKKEDMIISSEYLWDKFHQAFTVNYSAYLSYNQFFVDKEKLEVLLIQGSSLEKHSQINAESVDLVVTSPPYGDSKTTVAYGQFSRLSSQWLELGGHSYTVDSIANIDTDLLGGKTNNVSIDSDIVNKSISLKSIVDLFQYKIKSESDKKKKTKLTKRLKDILSFYIDLDISIGNGAFYLKKEKYFILVTASRIVKEVKLHTDIIISELAEHYGLDLKAIMYRNIPNKRMPSKVSATNIIGEKARTMTRESIIVLKKLR